MENRATVNGVEVMDDGGPPVSGETSPRNLDDTRRLTFRLVAHLNEAEVKIRQARAELVAHMGRMWPEVGGDGE